MGQKCGAVSREGGPTCKPAKEHLSSCVCRHVDLKSLRPGVDEQEDIVHQFVEGEARKGGWLKVRHVDNMLVPQGGIYTGQARDDGQPHGVGCQRWPDGTVYSGSWVAGAAHGHGKLSKSDGSGYEGNWVEGRKHGAGSEWLVDHSEYRGEFADGQKHGSGSFRWEGGASYTGEFCEDALQGEGIFLWGDGRSYRGQWVQSRMHGQGRFEWPDGKSFEGKYESDKKHGPGVFTWPDGSKCVSIWMCGKQHGMGTHVNSKGIARKGRWKNGTLDQWIEPLSTQETPPSPGRGHADVAGLVPVQGNATDRSPSQVPPSMTDSPG
uniref:MORN repeat-containing protein 5 n=1 Tax=Pyrodinium bahamense TaxID=73915 RepID=A0A7R9ZVU1_9DINO|mmetsp:Transcript_11655/g.31882  ORF Transcript_11655/g.31882 Transcript_11655/m.31882 type:complete len:322 (+) Transcript_11655:88-1053(+)